MGKIRAVRSVKLTHRARRMRREDTEAEARLWLARRDQRLDGSKWRRQVPVGPFIVDFLCDDAALVVEVDGAQHAERTAYDARRTAYLSADGLHVLRFWNAEVLTNRDGVCLTILDALDDRRRTPSPAARERVG
jgi:very-short-patch-repair endonuclease